MKEKIINLKNKMLSIIMANKIVSIIIGILLIVVIALIIILCNKTEIGSTNGNLNNLGFSIKDGNWIYAYLGNSQNGEKGIYKMKQDGSKKEKINDDYGVYLNKVGKYIYYIEAQNYNIVRIKTNGEDKKVIVENVDPDKISIIDNWIYYFDESNLCRVKTNGQNKQILSNKSIENYEISKNWIYYSYANDGKYVISKMKINGEDNTKVDSDAGEMFFIKGNNIYYIYKNYNSENYEYSYELYKMKTDGKDKEKVADIQGEIYINSVNYSDNTIYYTKINEEGELAIYSINLNGKDEKKIVKIEGYSTAINIFDNWIYYIDQNEKGEAQMFRVKTNGENKQGL